MKFRVFIDTTAFIYSFEFAKSNSAKIIELLNKGAIEVTISERVVKEITRYFEKFYGIALARKFRRFLFDNCKIISAQDIENKMHELKGKIKDKDLEQLAAVRQYGIKYLIAYDRDFENFEEYITPKRFLEIIGEEFSESDF